MPTPSGMKNELVQVMRKRDMPGRLGENKVTGDAFSPHGDPAWANIKSVMASEAKEGGRVQATVIYTVTVSSFTDVRSNDRLSWEGRTLHIQGIKPKGLRREDYEITCTEEVQ